MIFVLPLQERTGHSKDVITLASILQSFSWTLGLLAPSAPMAETFQNRLHAMIEKTPPFTKVRTVSTAPCQPSSCSACFSSSLEFLLPDGCEGSGNLSCVSQTETGVDWTLTSPRPCRSHVLPLGFTKCLFAARGLLQLHLKTTQCHPRL